MPPQAPASGLREASWEDVVGAIARQHGVNPLLALAVARKESSLNPHAIGDSGDAVGMFQLHVPAAEDMGLSADDRHNPLQNITGGIKYLKTLSERYQGDVNKTLMAYNGGMDNVDKGTVSPAAQAYAAEVIASLSAGVRQQAGSKTPITATVVPDPMGPPTTPPAGTPAAPRAYNPYVGPIVSDFLGGARAQFARTVFGGGDLIRRGAQAIGLPVKRVINTPEVQQAMTPPDSTAGQVGQFATEAAEYALPSSILTKTAKGIGLARTLMTAGVSANRARIAAAAAEGSLQAAGAAGISVLNQEDPTASAIVSGAMPVAAQVVTSMAPVIRRAATTRLARFMERGVTGQITPEIERTLAQAANDFIDLPLQRTWRATARMTKGRREAIGQDLGAALAGPLGDTPIPLKPIMQGLDDLVAEAQHIVPAGQGQMRTVTYKNGIVDAVAELKSLLTEYDTAYKGLVPARQVHDLKAVWQKAVFPGKEAAKPISSTRELLTTAQKEAYLRGAREISRVLDSNAPEIASLDRAVGHAIKLDQTVKRLAGKARTQTLATPLARHSASAAGAALGFVGGGAAGHPFIGATVGGFTSRMLMNALQSPRWRLTPIRLRRQLANALARGQADRARALITPIYAAAVGDRDNILTADLPANEPVTAPVP